MVSSGEDRHNSTKATTTSVPVDDGASDSDGDAAEDILEESPDKRWSKRREQVKQRDVPGIDVAYLAMDNETGNEVVWNEVQFSERKNFRAQEEKINAVFDNLTQLVHTNLVKFHKYWTDSKSEKPRIIFITEYMSSGSMSAFLQRTRKAASPLSIKAWKKWTTQILSALNYLHSSDPSIIHGNLTCNTVFIQQNGLIKIGCGISMCKDGTGHNLLVAPDAINHHVKTCRENMRFMHYIAPEYENSTEVTSAADIYSFGICSLEIAVIGGLSGCQNGSSEGPVTEDVIEKAIKSLEDPLQQDFIRQCLRKNPEERPNARQLLFHQILFEVHSLKLLAAHAIVDSKRYDDVSDSVFRIADNEKIAATSKLREMAYCQVSAFQLDLEKFLDDVRNGIYPLTAFAPLAHQPSTTLRAYSIQNPSVCLSQDASSQKESPASLNNSTSATIGNVTDRKDEQTLHHHHHLNGHTSTSSKEQPLQKSSSPEVFTDDDATAAGPATNQSTTTTNNNSGSTVTSSTMTHDSLTGTTTATAAATTASGNGNNGDSTTHHTPPPAATIDENGTAGGGGGADGGVRSENRHILEINVHIEDDEVSIVLLLEDQMHRQLTTSLSKSDTAGSLTENLVTHGFVCQLDSEGVEMAIQEAFEIRAQKLAENELIEEQQQQSQNGITMTNGTSSHSLTTSTTTIITTTSTTTTSS